MWKMTIQILKNTKAILKEISILIDTLKRLLEVIDNEN